MTSLAAFLCSTPDSPTDGNVRVAPELFGAPEHEVIARLRADDEVMYAHVYAVLRPRLIAVARDYVPAAIAEEIAQDVLALLWNRRAEWPTARGVTTYLYAAARNRARDTVRHEGVVGRVAVEATAREHTHATAHALGIGTPPMPPDDAVEHADAGHVFLRALSRLPDGARTAFTLRWIHRLGYPEIAEVMGVSEPAARKQVSRARETLLAELKAKLE